MPTPVQIWQLRIRERAHGAMEEATLRAKIQAMKNLLEAKRQSAAPAVAAPSYGYAQPNHGPYQSRKYARPTPVNRSWNRFSPPAATANRRNVGAGSANKVWRREAAPVATTAAAEAPSQAGGRSATPSVIMGKNKAWKRPVSR